MVSPRLCAGSHIVLFIFQQNVLELGKSCQWIGSAKKTALRFRIETCFENHKLSLRAPWPSPDLWSTPGHYGGSCHYTPYVDWHTCCSTQHSPAHGGCPPKRDATLVLVVILDDRLFGNVVYFYTRVQQEKAGEKDGYLYIKTRTDC